MTCVFVCGVRRMCIALASTALVKRVDVEPLKPMRAELQPLYAPTYYSSNAPVD